MDKPDGRQHTLSMPLSHARDKDRLFDWLDQLMSTIDDELGVDNYWIEIKVRPLKESDEKK